MSEQHLVDDVLIAYLLDELDPSDRRDVESHVAACAACGETIRRMDAAMARFRESALPDPPARVLMQLIEAQARNRKSSWARPWWRSPIPAAAAVFIQTAIFLTGFWIGHHSAPAPGSSKIDGETLRGGSLLRHQRSLPGHPPMDVWFTSSDTAVAAWLLPRNDVGIACRLTGRRG